MDQQKLKKDASMRIESWHLDGEREELESRRDIARSLLDHRRAAQEVNKALAGLIQTCVRSRTIRRLTQWQQTIFSCCSGKQ